MTAFGQYEDDDSASTLKQRDHKDATDLVVSHPPTSSASKGATEDGTGRGTPITVQAFNWQQGDAEYSLRDDSSALAADSRPAVMIPQAFDEMNFTTDGDTHHVLRAGTKQSTGVMVPHATGNGQTLFQPEWAADETGTIQARGYKGLNHENVRDGQAVVQQYGVRRLTPVECERLQSFPDGWTEPAGSDSARYKAMGNAVTVNVVRWILGRLP